MSVKCYQYTVSKCNSRLLIKIEASANNNIFENRKKNNNNNMFNNKIKTI